MQWDQFLIFQDCVNALGQLVGRGVIMMWEYLVVKLPKVPKEDWTVKSTEAFLNKYGKEGWENYHITTWEVYYFKREVYG